MNNECGGAGDSYQEKTKRIGRLGARLIDTEACQDHLDSLGCGLGVLPDILSEVESAGITSSLALTKWPGSADGYRGRLVNSEACDVRC